MTQAKKGRGIFAGSTHVSKKVLERYLKTLAVVHGESNPDTGRHAHSHFKPNGSRHGSPSPGLNQLNQSSILSSYGGSKTSPGSRSISPPTADPGSFGVGAGYNVETSPIPPSTEAENFRFKPTRRNQPYVIHQKIAGGTHVAGGAYFAAGFRNSSSPCGKPKDLAPRLISPVPKRHHQQSSLFENNIEAVVKQRQAWSSGSPVPESPVTVPVRSPLFDRSGQLAHQMLRVPTPTSNKSSHTLLPKASHSATMTFDFNVNVTSESMHERAISAVANKHAMNRSQPVPRHMRTHDNGLRTRTRSPRTSRADSAIGKPKHTHRSDVLGRQNQAHTPDSPQLHAWQRSQRRGFKGQPLKEGFFYNGQQSRWLCDEGPDYDALLPLEQVSGGDKEGPQRPLRPTVHNPSLSLRSGIMRMSAREKNSVDRTSSIESDGVGGQRSTMSARSSVSTSSHHRDEPQYEPNPVDLNSSVVFKNEEKENHKVGPLQDSLILQNHMSTISAVEPWDLEAASSEFLQEQE